MTSSHFRTKDNANSKFESHSHHLKFILSALAYILFVFVYWRFSLFKLISMYAMYEKKNVKKTAERSKNLRAFI